MLKEMCRLCLTHTTIYFSLKDDTVQMLEALTSIKLTSNDGFANVICLKCQLNLKLAYTIQQRFIKANQKILNKLLVKEELILTPDEFIIKEESGNDDERPRDIPVSNFCIICGLTTSSMNTHIKEHFDQKQTCDLCNKSYENMSFYKKHLVDHQKVTDLYQCKQCGAKFLYQSLYNIHFKEAHKKRLIQRLMPKPQVFTCDLCSKIFHCKTKFKAHQVTHIKKSCPICQKLVSAGNYHAHVRDHDDTPRICEICGATLKNHSCLRMHLKYSHNGETFSCDQCDKVFKKKISLNNHLKTIHAEPTIVCDSCGKMFYTAHRLDIHKRSTHLQLRPFVCDFCEKGFSSRFALRTHRRQHTNETPYKCDFCGDGFRQRVSLRAHKKSKHNIEEAKVFVCGTCSKAFVTVWALRTHQRSH